MTTKGVIGGLFGVLSPLIVAQNGSDPIVDIGCAKYRGLYNTTLDINDFWIPFAAPPVGQLRWDAPQPYVPPSNSSDTIFDATTYGNTCVQGYPVWALPNPGIPTGSEDCLILNVIQPGNLETDSSLPVLVTIHGGGYTTGDATVTQPYAMVRHSKNSFISVNVQYRLGAYGFLGSKKYVQDGGIENVGLLDQRLALEWVQKNIAAFGGDPDRVTIQGGSAGGGSVTSQLIMHGGEEKAPFRAAIAQYPFWQQHLRDEQLATQYDYLLSAADCTNLDCLKELPEDTLKLATQATYAKAYVDGAYGYGGFYYGPYVDGKIIQDLPSKEFEAGHFSKVPVLVDRAGYEGWAFTNQSLTLMEEETADLRIQFPYAHPEFTRQLYRLYPSAKFNATYWQRQAWFGDFSINCPTYYIAASLVNFQVPVYKQIFNAGSQIHGASGPYLLDINLDTEPTEESYLGDIMKDWYTSFAMHADPNAESWSHVTKPHWPEYKDAGKLMSINYTEVGVVNDLYYDDTRRCDFFWRNGHAVQN